jgi:class 3 adenylate cyclase/tetratricopeptide (TPR) repeat protein
VICPRCEQAIPADAKFCPQCGTRLGPRATGLLPTPATGDRLLAVGAAPESERKQVTVLFADLKGSMELLADRDPEEAQKLLDPILEYMMEAVHHHEGTVNQVMGDGIMALFGAPVAHEDHAVRGCYAALRMQESVGRYADEMLRQHGAPLQIRVGLNSGEVVVRALGGDLHTNYAAVGQTVHLAARMEQMARPGSILAGADTVRLARPWVEAKALGPVKVKGLEAPVEVFEVIGVGTPRSRLQAAATEGLTQFVGREDELARLRAVLEQVREGARHVVALVGEAGVGKSRVLRQFARAPWLGDCLLLESESVAYGSPTAYKPGVEILRRYFRIEATDDARAAQEKVAGRVLTLDRSLEDAVTPLLAVVGALPEDSPFRTLAVAERRQRAVEAILRLMQRESEHRPLALIFEDLQWAHPQTRRALDVVVGALPARTLLLVSYRPEYDDGWQGRPDYTRIHVDPLPPATADGLLAALVGPDPELASLRQRLIERTEGNPLFLEECVRSLVQMRALAGERGAYRLVAAPAALEIPATVQAVLAARIDRLSGEDKRLLQSAAVIGEDVPVALLAALAGLAPEDLAQPLGQLERAELLARKGGSAEPEYRFTHSLTHSVAYETLLHERRRQLHAEIVAIMEGLYADRLDEHVDRIAHHAFRGEVWDKAATYLRRAGTRSLSSFAGREAITYLEQALQAVTHLPDGRGAREQAVDIRLDLRNALIPQGQHPEIFEHLREALRLAESLDDPRRLGRVYSFLSNHYWNVGASDLALDSGRRALDLAESSGDLPLQVVGNFSMGGTLRALGQYRECLEYMRRVIALLDRDLTYEFFGQHGLPAVLARSHLVWSLAELGEFPEATTAAEESLSIAGSAHHAYTQSHAYLGLGGVLVRQGRFRRAIPVLEQGVALSERGAPLLFPPLAADLGVALARTGEVARGLGLAERAVARATAMGRLGRLPLLMTHLADLMLTAGRHADAARLATEALALAVTQKERGNEVYALRLLGKVAVYAPEADAARASAHLERAVALAEELGMRPLRARCYLLLGQLARATDRARAADYMRRAAALFQDMEMRYWFEYAQAELRAA